MLLLAAALTGCTGTPAATGASTPVVNPPSSTVASAAPVRTPTPGTLAPGTRPTTPPLFAHRLGGMPAVVGGSVYGGTTAGGLSATVAHDPALLYVPDSTGTTVHVISQRTHKVVRIIRAGQLSQHVVPSYDLRTLYVTSSEGNRLVALNPRTGKKVHTIGVPRPYNLYFTPDGQQAIVMVEQHNAIRFVDPLHFRRRAQLVVPGCLGPNHADFAASGRYVIITCEFSGTLVKISTRDHRLLQVLHLGARSMPQDIRISPDGAVFYVADMGSDTVRLIDGSRLRQVGSIATPRDPHGLYPSRDGRSLYVSDRGAGQISVVSFARRRISTTWTIPGGGSPDMGGVSADGRTLWLCGRYDGVVYGISTVTGRLTARIHVGGSPHGMAVWPQPGRYSLGHTGNMR